MNSMHINFAVAVVAALTLGNVAPSVKGDDDCSQLDLSRDIDYCGGAHGDLSGEISCTPFPAKNMKRPPYQMKGFCNHEDLAKFAGSATGAKVWQSSGADNYWVFHGCDGAGMMDDCLGGTTYVEQFGPYSKTEQVPLNIHKCSGGWESHCTQPFVHPGTNLVYEWYNAGQLTYGQGKWPDQLIGKPWWNNMGLPDTDQLGNGSGTAFVIMYPWVCDNWNSESLYWLWGRHEPYGEKTYNTENTKCYYDNEPWDNDHWHGQTIPPIWQAYKFYFDDSTQEITGWKLAEKFAEHPDPVFYYLDPAGSPEFQLQSSGSPPWMAEE